jgi:hypothetical protein
MSKVFWSKFRPKITSDYLSVNTYVLLTLRTDKQTIYVCKTLLYEKENIIMKCFRDKNVRLDPLEKSLIDGLLNNDPNEINVWTNTFTCIKDICIYKDMSININIPRSNMHDRKRPFTEKNGDLQRPCTASVYDACTRSDTVGNGFRIRRSYKNGK